MRPIGAPLRIRWASAATWSSWPCVSKTAAIGGGRRHAHVGQQLLDRAGAIAAAREPDAAVDDDALAAPVDAASCCARPRPGRRRASLAARAAPRSVPGAASAERRPPCRAGHAPVPYWRRAGVWRSLVARSVRVGEVPSSNLGTPIAVGGVLPPTTVSPPTRRGGDATLVSASPPAGGEARARSAHGYRAALRCSTSRTPGTTSASAWCRRSRCSRRKAPADARRGCGRAGLRADPAGRHRRRRAAARQRRGRARSTRPTSPPSPRRSWRSAGVFALRIALAGAARARALRGGLEGPTGRRWAQGAADVLIIGACGTLAWLTGLIAPRGALVVGILVATAVDVYQVLAEDVQPVSQALSAAQPAGRPAAPAGGGVGHRVDGLGRRLPRGAARRRGRRVARPPAAVGGGGGDVRRPPRLGASCSTCSTCCRGPSRWPSALVARWPSSGYAAGGYQGGSTDGDHSSAR